MSAYTEADIEAASQALYLIDYGRWTSGPDPLGTPWGTSREKGWRETYRTDARAILDAVAPAIAARVLREAADKFAAASPSEKFAPGWLAGEMGLRARADEIEAAS